MVLAGGEPVIVTLALMFGLALCCTGAALLYAWSLWPLVPLSLCMAMSMPLFCCGLLENAIDDTPACLVDNSNETAERWESLKWFLFGVLFMSATLSSWMLGRSEALSMAMAWVTSVGAWSAMGVVCLGGALAIRAKRANERRGGG